MLAVELPIAEATERRARPGARPDPRDGATGCSTRPPAGCGSAAGSRTRAIGRAATRRSSPGTRRCSPSCCGADARRARHRRAARDRARHRGRARRHRRRGRRVTRRLASVALAIVAAVGLLGTPAATREVRAATPDLTIVADARYDVQPAQHRVRVTLDPDAREPPHRHEDHALLLRQGVPRGPARDQGVRDVVGRLGDAVGRRLEVDQGLHAPAARPGPAAVQRQDRHVPAPLRPARSGRRRDARPAHRRFAGVVPGLGVRQRLDLGRVGHGRLPEGLLGGRPGRLDPEARDRRDRPGDLPLRDAVEPAVVLRLPRRRPPGRLRHDVPQGDRRGQPGRDDGPVLARRQGVVQARRGPHGQGPAGPGAADRAGLAAGRDPDGPRGGQPLDRRLRRPVRPGARASSRSPTTPTPSSSSTSPPTAGSTARSSRTAGPTRGSPRTTRSRRPRPSRSRRPATS